MKLPIIKLFIQVFIFCALIHATGASGDEVITDKLLSEFNSSMAKIKDSMERLQDEEFSTFSSIKLIISGALDNTKKGYNNAIETIIARINLEDSIQKEIQYASDLYTNIADAFATEWNRKMRQVASDFEANLNKAIEDLDNNSKELSKLLDIERLDIFDYMARDKIAMLEVLKNQHVDTNQFETSFFSQLETMVRLMKSVDKTQLLFLEFVVHCLDLKEERIEIEQTMAKLNMINYLDVLQVQSIDAGNISSALDFTFARFIKDSVPVSPLLPPTNNKGFTVEIKPDRGVGGVYHVRTHDKIKFTLKATRDCWFILRYRDTMGREKQLCPNERYRGGNFLKANIPLVIPDDLPYDFVAQKPYGIDTVEVIASPYMIEYLPEKDKLALGRYRGPSKVNRELKDRGIAIQQKQLFESLSQGGSYDKVFYNPDAEGNAVITKTFIRVVP